MHGNSTDENYIETFSDGLKKEQIIVAERNRNFFDCSKEKARTKT
jgi:hypothetical protein